MNVCQHFHCNTCQDAFGLLLCKISFEKNQLLNVSGLQFTYNNRPREKKKSCQMLTCLVFIFVWSREIVAVLCFLLLKGHVKLFI